MEKLISKFVSLRQTKHYCRNDFFKEADMKSCSLKRFIIGDVSHRKGIVGCINYDIFYGGCLFGDTCLVEKGKRCSYFEKAVLPTAAELGIQESINEAYSERTGLASRLISGKKTRFCECGEVLKPRQKFCEKCVQRRRRATYYQSRHKTVNRQMSSATVY